MQNTLRSIVGDDAVHAPEIEIDGTRPIFLIEPESSAQIADILNAAQAEKWAVIPVGSGRAISLGNPPRKADILLSTQRLNAITDYEPADLTASVGAGCTLGNLNAALSEHVQFLPWDPPGGGSRTIGGIASTGRVGPLRLGFGQPRDWVLGLEAVTGDGTRLEVGGRVVKNVAGYDLTRLMVGSHGTLGIITRLNVKVRPIPPTELTGVIRGNDRERLWTLAHAILRSNVAPVALEIVSAEAARWCGLDVVGRADLLCARVAGEDADVRDQMLLLEQLALQHGIDVPEQIGAEYVQGFWGGVTDFPVNEEAPIAIRLSVPPSDLRELIGETVGTFGTLMEEIAWSASPAFGTLTVLLGGVLSDQRIEELVEAAQRFRSTCTARGGGLTILRAPLDVKTRMDVWGEAGSSGPLMAATRKLFDPAGCLNPGRYITGI